MRVRGMAATMQVLTALADRLEGRGGPARDAGT
jgi:hypothetical protein